MKIIDIALAVTFGNGDPRVFKLHVALAHKAVPRPGGFRCS